MRVSGRGHDPVSSGPLSYRTAAASTTSFCKGQGHAASADVRMRSLDQLAERDAVGGEIAHSLRPTSSSSASRSSAVLKPTLTALMAR